MAIFRGVGGSGDSSDNSFLQEVTAQANAASASASAASASASAASTSASNASNFASDAETAKGVAESSSSTAVAQAGIATSQADIATTKASEASASATAAQNLEITSASFDTADGTLTLTKANSGTITTDFDGRYLTTHQDISGKANLTGANFTGPVSVTGGSLSIGTLLANQNVNVFGNITVSGTVDGVDIASLENTVAGKADLTGDTFTGTITAPNVDISTTGTVTTNIATGTGGQGNTKTLNLGTGYGGSLVGLTTVNIGSQSTACQNTVNIGSGVSTPNREDTINLKGNVTVDGETDFNDSVTFNSDASGSGVYDLIATFNAKDSASTFEEAGRIGTFGQAYPPSRLIIGQGACGLTFYDFFGSRIIQPVNVTTGATNDAVVDLGGFAQRFKLGRFASGTTTSSDRNEKRDIEELTEAELRVAKRCKPLLRKYRRIDAYEEKGEDARIHFGIIAQDLDDAFTAEGLDAHRYAMFMEDTWYELEEGGHTYTSLDEIPEDLRSTAVEKTRMGVRYEQLLAFIIAAI
jgi:hypothetical protein